VIRIEVSIADINDNAPQFSINNQTISIKENLEINQTLTIFTVKDPDKGHNGTVNDVVISGEDGKYFYLIKTRQNSNLVVQLLTSSTKVDFEMNQQFNLTLVATDQGTPPKTNTTVLTINVEDVNDNSPQFVITQYVVEIVETDPVGKSIINVSATDADQGKFGIVSYTIIHVTSPGGECGNGYGLFTINSTSGTLYLNQSANGKGDCVFTLRVRAYDIGNQFSPATVQITIVEHGSLSFIVFGERTNYFNGTVIEGQGFSRVINVADQLGAVNYTIQFNGTEPEYRIEPFNSLASIIFPKVDWERTPHISGILTARTTNTPPLVGKLTFSITVLDINDNSPKFERTNFSVQENISIGGEIGVIVANDPDKGENGTVHYSLVYSNPTNLVILHSNGSIVVNDEIDFEQVERIELFVSAQDGGTPPMSQNETIYIDIENVNDNEPAFSDVNQSLLILTSMPLPIRWNITATDDDSGEFGNVTHRVMPSNASSFVNLNALSGEVMITKLPPPSSMPYLLVVQAVDGGNITSTLNISINVWTDFCQDDPCVHVVQCQNEFNSYKCKCQEDYGGQNCSILKNPCDYPPNPCQYGGKCVNTEDQLDYRCICTDSYSGRNCTLSTVSFKPRSFLKYQLPNLSPSSRNFHVAIQIAPKSLDGLLLYVREGDDFISMEMERGRVIVHTPHKDISDDTMLITTDGIWYNITLIKSEAVSISSVCV